MPGILSIVSTPIGNLEDVTLRALRVLREADLIAAEDTRRTRILLQHYDIRTPTTSLHEHNERQKIPGLLRRLESGQRLALVSDAGTPAVSDPGYQLIRTAREGGHRIEVIPGASAVLTSLVASGLSTDAFTFLGFPPIRSKARKMWLDEVASSPHTVVFFEAPHRLLGTLGEIAARTGPDRIVAVGRELTKVHETLVISPIKSLLEQLREPVKGEVTVVVSAADASHSKGDTLDRQRLIRDFGLMTNDGGLSRREIIQTLAERYHLTNRQVYAEIESLKNRADSQERGAG